MGTKDRDIDDIQEHILVRCTIKCSKCKKEGSVCGADDFYFAKELVRYGWVVKKGEVLCGKCSNDSK